MDTNAFLLEAKIESLESELSAYKSTCTQLDKQILQLKDELKNEQMQSMKWKEMLNQQHQLQSVSVECQMPLQSLQSLQSEEHRVIIL